MVALDILIVTLACIISIQAATEDDVYEEEYEDDSFDEEEFEYFYNMELLDKLELLANNETEIDEEALLQLAEEDFEYEDTSELDAILDELLKEGDLIEEVLDEIGEYTFDDTDEVTYIQYERSSKDLFNQIIFFVSLVGFIIMFIISSVFTIRHFYKTKFTAVPVEEQRDLEFVFIPGRRTLPELP